MASHITVNRCAFAGALAANEPRSAAIWAKRLTTLVFHIGFAMVWWWACLPMLSGSIAGGWLGALLGKRLSHRVVRVWTLVVTGATTITFFVRAYGG